MIDEKICDYISDIMDFYPDRVVIGYSNINKVSDREDYISLTSSGVDLQLGSSRTYDSNTEKEQFVTYFKKRATVTFFGENAESNAYRFINIQNSQVSRDAQKKYEITFLKGGGVNSLKNQIGDYFISTYEIEVMIQYSSSLEIDTKRIEEIPLNYKGE
jgi:hypothetical protein